MAYQSAVNHGLHDIVQTLKKTMDSEPKYNKKAVALVPPRPLWQNFEKADDSKLLVNNSVQRMAYLRGF